MNEFVKSFRVFRALKYQSRCCRLLILSVFLLTALCSTGQNISVVLRTAGSAPAATIINPPTGVSNSAAAPFAGTAWNAIGESSKIPSGTAPGTYTLYAGLPLVNSADNSIAQTLSVDYVVLSSTLTSEPAGSSGENTLQPGGVMENAWRNYDNGAGSYFIFVVSNLPASTAYGVYYYGATTGSGQFATVILPTANILSDSPSTSSTTNTTPNSNGSFGSLWTVSGGTTNLMPQGTTWNTIYGQSDATGVFRLEFKGTGSAAYLNGFQITPLSAPAITGLTNQTVVQGNSATLSATNSGLPTASLQWHSNNVALPGQTNAALTLNNVQYVQNGTVYSLIATNIIGATTNNLTLSVVVTPAISGLNNQADSVGSSVTIEANVSGVPAPSLQWQFKGAALSDGPTGDGSTISGSGSDALNILNAQASDSGTYSLVASNSAGLVTGSMVLTISSSNVPPDITGPANQTVVQDSNTTFTASVSGLPLPTLQWYVQGITIPTATNSSLTVSNVLYSQNGSVYSLVASNQAGSKTNSATLFVQVPPAITQQPTNLVVTNTQTATFVVSAGGVPAPSYQWYFNGTPIPGAVASNYVIASVSPTNMGNYSALIANSVGSITSAVATLTVNSTMSIVTLGPANSATGICYDTPLYITFSTPPVLTTPGIGKIRIYNANNPSTPVDILDMSQNVTLETPFAVNVQQRAIAGDTFYSYPVIVTGNTAAIYPHLDLVTSNQTYYVTIDSTVFTDTNGAYFTGISSTNVWSFETKTGGPANRTNMIVSQDNSGDFVTIQGAIDSVPANNTTPTLINIHNGTYTEIVEAH
ncbi:MAG TPA: immunoglobulin domain-containing protein, partial [Verrucomicrobiae bacterium]